MKKILLATIILIGLGSHVYAKEVYVKDRGNIDVANGHFKQLGLKGSTLVKNMYYDKGNSYLLVKLSRRYYQYCSIPQSVVGEWQRSESLSKYYNNNIKSNYDCKVNPVPSYQ
jgi:hypothetical protein